MVGWRWGEGEEINWEIVVMHQIQKKQLPFKD